MYIYNTVVCKLKYSTVLKVLACGHTVSHTRTKKDRK